MMITTQRIVIKKVFGSGGKLFCNKHVKAMSRYKTGPNTKAMLFSIERLMGFEVSLFYPSLYRNSQLKTLLAIGGWNFGTAP